MNPDVFLFMSVISGLVLAGLLVYVFDLLIFAIALPLLIISALCDIFG